MRGKQSLPGSLGRIPFCHAAARSGAAADAMAHTSVPQRAAFDQYESARAQFSPLRLVRRRLGSQEAARRRAMGLSVGKGSLQATAAGDRDRAMRVFAQGRRRCRGLRRGQRLAAAHRATPLAAPDPAARGEVVADGGLENCTNSHAQSASHCLAFSLHPTAAWAPVSLLFAAGWPRPWTMAIMCWPRSSKTTSRQ